MAYGYLNVQGRTNPELETKMKLERGIINELQPELKRQDQKDELLECGIRSICGCVAVEFPPAFAMKYGGSTYKALEQYAKDLMCAIRQKNPQWFPSNKILQTILEGF